MAFACPLAISFLLTAVLLRWAPRLGLVDMPSARKVHSRPVPRGGGLAIFVAVALTACLMAVFNLQVSTFTFQFTSADLSFVLGLSALIVLLGLLDDLRPLPWQLRLGVQTACALIVVARWPEERTWLVRAAAVLWIVGLVNAFNMLDNMDALSAGVAWIAAAAFAVDLGPGTPGLVPFLLLMGAVSGFLWFNRPPARIFMGDAGSTFLGFYLGVFSLESGFTDDGPSRWAVPLCVLAVPWYDLITVVTLRLWQGRSPFHADKQHLSHRLVALGLGSPGAVGVIYVLALASGAAGVLAGRVPETTPWVLGGLVSGWLVVAAVEYVRHFRRG
jgi:UDP-GlcNAc:undecaprenyl-phosphate GlcNAc-1-phosphate transferase